MVKDDKSLNTILRSRLISGKEKIHLFKALLLSIMKSGNENFFSLDEERKKYGNEKITRNHDGYIGKESLTKFIRA